MKAKEVLKILKVTRQTLSKYVKTNKIRVIVNQNGDYDYNEDDVISLAGYDVKRHSVIYARVSTQKQKKDLQNQISILTEYANKNGFSVDTVYSDIASGISYDRNGFYDLLQDVLQYKIKTVFITYKDRLTRVSYDMWKQLFKMYNCDLITINDITEQTDTSDKEIFEDIISLLHCFAMKMYSNRRRKKIDLIKEDIENTINE